MARNRIRTIASASLVLALCSALAWSHEMGFQPWSYVESEAMIDGKSTSLKVYKASDGRLAILGEPSEEAYVYSPVAATIGIPNSGTFHECAGRLWPKPDAAIGGVQMGGSKIEMDPRIKKSNAGFSFTDTAGRRVQIEYR